MNEQTELKRRSIIDAILLTEKPIYVLWLILQRRGGNLVLLAKTPDEQYVINNDASVDVVNILMDKNNPVCSEVRVNGNGDFVFRITKNTLYDIYNKHTSKAQTQDDEDVCDVFGTRRNNGKEDVCNKWYAEMKRQICDNANKIKITKLPDFDVVGVYFDKTITIVADSNTWDENNIDMLKILLKDKITNMCGAGADVRMYTIDMKDISDITYKVKTMLPYFTHEEKYDTHKIKRNTSQIISIAHKLSTEMKEDKLCQSVNVFSDINPLYPYCGMSFGGNVIVFGASVVDGGNAKIINTIKASDMNVTNIIRYIDIDRDSVHNEVPTSVKYIKDLVAYTTSILLGDDEVVRNALAKIDAESRDGFDDEDDECVGNVSMETIDDIGNTYRDLIVAYNGDLIEFFRTYKHCTNETRKNIVDSIEVLGSKKYTTLYKLDLNHIPQSSYGEYEIAISLIDNLMNNDDHAKKCIRYIATTHVDGEVVKVNSRSNTSYNVFKLITDPNGNITYNVL